MSQCLYSCFLSAACIPAALMHVYRKNEIPVTGVMYEKTANNKEVYLCSLKGSYDAILKTIILCMYKKHIIFQILCIIVVTLCPAPLKRVVFYKAPPSNKCSLL